MPWMTDSMAFLTWACFTPRKTGWRLDADLAKISPMGASLKNSFLAPCTAGSCCAFVLLGMLPKSVKMLASVCACVR